MKVILNMPPSPTAFFSKTQALSAHSWKPPLIACRTNCMKLSSNSNPKRRNDTASNPTNCSFNAYGSHWNSCSTSPAGRHCKQQQHTMNQPCSPGIQISASVRINLNPTKRIEKMKTGQYVTLIANRLLLHMPLGPNVFHLDLPQVHKKHISETNTESYSTQVITTNSNSHNEQIPKRLHNNLKINWK